MKEKEFCVYVVLIFVLVLYSKTQDGDKSYITEQNDNHGGGKKCTSVLICFRMIGHF